MTEIVQTLIAQLGQSQQERMPEALAIHFADVDERTTQDLLLFAKKLAQSVNYYRTTLSAPAGDWSAFFPYDETTVKQLLESTGAGTSPHLALFLAFLELYKKPQEVINRITGRHLDFHYREVLRLTRKAPLPDKAHLLLELKKNASPTAIGPDDLFSAGKDATGVERIYAPTLETVINTARVESLRSVYRDDRGHGTIRYAPVANSADGLGGKPFAKWPGFGHPDLPPAEVGFAVASPVLRMRQGIRKVTLDLTLGTLDPAKLSDSVLQGAFEVFISGEKSWLGPYRVSPRLGRDRVLQFDFTVPESEPAVVDYNAAIHGYAYTAQAPIVQVLLKAGGADIGYNDFRGVTLNKARVSVEVSNITALGLESDQGALDPRKAFLPFGAQPTAGARFQVGCAEAFSKKLSEVKLQVTWKEAPADFAAHYNGYGASGIGNGYFTAAVSFKDGGSWENTSYGIALFESANPAERAFTFAPGASSTAAVATEGRIVHALNAAGSVWAVQAADKYVLEKPVLASSRQAAPEIRPGFMTFSLEKSFLHSTYRRKHIENVLKYSKATSGDPVILNEPYTPAIQAISLSYRAHSSEVNIASTALDEFANDDVQFFHIAYFGQRREHGYPRRQFGFLTDKAIPLLPAYDSAGELLIGLGNLDPGAGVSLLFQVADGSADPDLAREPVTWSVLCDNYWKPLDRGEAVLDTTGQLLTSGIIKFVIPAEATTRNTILPAGLWLKAAVARHPTAVCQLIEVAANAVEVRFIDNGNDPGHLSRVLEAGKIGKLKQGLAAVKAVRQPYASFGGSPWETDQAFYARGAERLRHKNRCISPWDYERIILEAFPRVHRVKCIPHAKDGVWLAPGHVLIVAVPDLKNSNAMNPLEPKVDADTLARITAHVQKRAGMQVKIQVKNPAYQKIHLDFKVKFNSGYEFSYYSEASRQALIQFLSPWAYETERTLSFGGKVYKSVLLDFVEDLDYVDYVTDFKMYSYTGQTNNYTDINEAQPQAPDAILVSDSTHTIAQAA